MNKIFATLLFAIIPALSFAQADVLETAVKVNDYFMNKYADPTLPTNVKRIRPSSLWTRAVYYEGLVALNEVAPEKRYIDYIDRWANFHKWTPRNGTKTTHADDQCCSQTYLDRYFMTGDKAMIDSVGVNLDKQMASGRNDYWTWIDAIQMAMPVYSKYYVATKDRKYLDYAMKSYTWARDTCGGGCYNKAEGLWWRDKDYVPPYKEKDGANCYWSRGNGWVYAALVKVMTDIGKDDPYYNTLKADFVAMSQALAKCQRKDGYWNVSLHSPVTYGGPEMTGTALFLYGMSWGIINGILDPAEYAPVCHRAWAALDMCVHKDGFLGYNQGTGKDPSAGQPVTYTSIPDFEDYGTGCFLLGATEYYKMLKAGRPLALSWPDASVTTRAGTRWWWPGSAVDSVNLAARMAEMAAAGINTVEITPIYGAQGNESRDIPYLTPEWMKSLGHVNSFAADLGMQVDMSNGTGWPFGGPWVPVAEAACKVVLVDSVVPSSVPAASLSLLPPVKDREHATLLTLREFPLDSAGFKHVMALYMSPTRQKVKRAAPGGEGWVIDHFDRTAVRHYLEHFDSAFAASGVKFPSTFFNDSYEVYGANWTPTLQREFKARRGYDIFDKLPELFGFVDDDNKVLADYRKTLGELLYENFTLQWVDWAHSHGVKVRNQAHGSPANLLDLYAAVDIPEIEGFGLSQFNIRGLRLDSAHVRKNFSDVSMLKYAPSAAHVAGKQLTSSETFTWLTEHFRTSLSQMKPDLDLMYTCGVNRMFFHGACYSPDDVEWPGWRFYASVDMTPSNSIWHDAPYLLDYISRCQSFLQMGAPDNDFLVYLPLDDLQRQRRAAREKGLLLSFDIHKMARVAPTFISSVLRIDSLGFDCDYISLRQLADVKLDAGRLIAPSGVAYKGIIIPTGTTVTPELEALIKPFGNLVVMGEDEAALNALATPEPMRHFNGLRAIRRSNTLGNHYFIANLSPDDVNSMIDLAVPFADAAWFDPMTGDITPAVIADGRVQLNLASGESRILRTFRSPFGIASSHPVSSTTGRIVDLTPMKWKLSLDSLAPASAGSFTLQGLSPWQALNEQAAVGMGTGVYTLEFDMPADVNDNSWKIDLGDVRESARVTLNGRDLGCAWAAPFVLDLRDALKPGRNVISIAVTNLPANRIADLDRRGVKWRNMKEINVVDIDYKKTLYNAWEPMPSGLNSSVRLIELVH